MPVCDAGSACLRLIVVAKFNRLVAKNRLFIEKTDKNTLLDVDRRGQSD